MRKTVLKVVTCGFAMMLVAWRVGCTKEAPPVTVNAPTPQPEPASQPASESPSAPAPDDSPFRRVLGDMNGRGGKFHPPTKSAFGGLGSGEPYGLGLKGDGPNASTGNSLGIGGAPRQNAPPAKTPQ